ncbi:MAG TPA: hypothetical protein VJV79_11760 [Polyangiaceae bacterium]|nr:hypothetical protein [Polyangiaceae bacterium]
MRRSLLLGPLLALACAPAPKPEYRTHSPAKVIALPGPDERLAQALRSIPRPAPVLSALPASALSRLQERLAGLDAERKLAVQSDDGPLVESLPLLHLVSGGTSPRALYALATTSAGSQELAGILGVEHDTRASTPDAARLSIVRELARCAALDFLRDRAADVALPGKGTALASRLVARAALAVGRRDLVLGARELLASIEPTSENRLEFADELARSGDASRASQVLLEARAAKRPPAAAAVAATQLLIEMARVANVPEPPTDVGSKVLRARAWLHLGRVDQARALLEGETEAAHARLDLAAALAETLIDHPSCPDLPPDVGGAVLCAVAFRQSEGVKRARFVLEAAWQTGAGRDDEAVEVYTALAHVIPWVHDTAADLSQGELRSEDSVGRVTLLRDKLAQIAVAAPKMAGLTLFLETVHAPSATGARGLWSRADSEALSAHALRLASTDTSRFAQAGVLAAAAVLAHQSDVSPLVDAIPLESTVPGLRLPRASLHVWLTASTGSRERLEAARSELATIMTQGLGAPLERARLVLGVSEVGTLVDSSDRSYQLLSRVSGQLLSDNIPPDLALRAVLDASGALAHGQRFEQAAKILSGAASAELPEELSRARDLLALIRGYELVLDARDAEASTLPRLRPGFNALAASVHGEAARVWFELWNREFDARLRDAECLKKKRKVCAEARALRRTARRALDARLGTQASAVLSRGALPSGSFDAGFRFTVEKGLEPLIIFDPSVLSIGLPKFSMD